MVENRPATSGFPALIRERNRARSWWVRAALLIGLALTFRGFLHDPHHRSIWSGINLTVHEVGDLLFAPFPLFVAAAGGTLLELAVPLLAGVLLVSRRDDFGGALALFWLGTVLVGAAPGLLEHDGAVLRSAGLAAMAGGLAGGGWIAALMATDRERPRPGSRLLEGNAGSLAREDAAFRAWWAKQDGCAKQRGGDEERGEPPATPARTIDAALSDPASRWLDGKEEAQGALTDEEKRFRDWLRKRP